MNTWRNNFSKRGAETLLLLATAGVLISTPVSVQAQDGSLEVSVLGGVQGLLENDTGVQDDFVNIPVAAAVAYQATDIWAVAAEFSWLIPVENSVTLSGGGAQDLKSPDILAYQANVRASLPLQSSTLRPYLTAGLGAMTFLSTSDADRYPQLDESETAFAINFGLGTSVPLAPSVALLADFRQFVAFPQHDAAGLSTGSDADPVWMPRGTLGLRYSF